MIAPQPSGAGRVTQTPFALHLSAMRNAHSIGRAPQSAFVVHPPEPVDEEVVAPVVDELEASLVEALVVAAEVDEPDVLAAVDVLVPVAEPVVLPFVVAPEVPVVELAPPLPVVVVDTVLLQLVVASARTRGAKNAFVFIVSTPQEERPFEATRTSVAKEGRRQRDEAIARRRRFSGTAFQEPSAARMPSTLFFASPKSISVFS